MSEAIVVGVLLLLGMLAELFGNRCERSTIKRWILRHIVPCLCFLGIVGTLVFVLARLLVAQM